MKLSIITVNLNNREGLQRTIDSVVSQSFKDFEWIVIDGGSTDGSKELIEQYADRFAYWVSEPDKGIYNAMNKGIKVAKGEYLQFLNSGDWLWDGDILQEVLSDEVCGNADIVYGKTMVHDVNGYVFESGHHFDPFTPYSLVAYSMPHQSTFTKRMLFERIGLFDEEFRLSGDLDFFFRAIIINHALTKHIDRSITHFAGGGLSMTAPGLEAEEKKMILEKYMPSGSILDFEQYLAYRKSDKLLKENNKAIEVYDTLHRRWFTRKIMHFLYRLTK